MELKFTRHAISYKMEFHVELERNNSSSGVFKVAYSGTVVAIYST